MLTVHNVGSGSSNPTLDALIQQLTSANDAANSDSQKQYKTLLDSIAATQRSILGNKGAGGYLANAGQQAIVDTKQATADSLGKANQDLINSGLGNSTIKTSALAGIANKGQQSLNNINEAVAGQKAGLGLDLGKLNADAILSKQNQGPDMSMYLQLIRQLAASQPKPTTMLSTAGSINALNAPMQYSSNFGNPSAPPPPPPPAMGAYYNAATMGGGLSRPGDTFFGNSI